jgi:hypothetical protein
MGVAMVMGGVKTTKIRMTKIEDGCISTIILDTKGRMTMVMTMVMATGIRPELFQAPSFPPWRQS